MLAMAGLSAWVVLPYAGLALLLGWRARRGRLLWPWSVAALLVGAAGVGMLLDVIVFNPDAQSAIGVVVTPVLQLAAGLLLAPLAWLAGRWVRR